MIKKLLCKKTDTLLKVLKIIDNNAMGIAFITDEDNKLCGVVTDGDIRRALLKDIKLDERVQNIVSNNFIYGYINESYEELIKKMIS